MFKLQILLCLLLSTTTNYCQKHQSYLTIELIPVASMQTNGSGINVGSSFSKKRIIQNVSIGFLFNNFKSGNEIENISVDGKPIREWSSEIDYQTTRPFTFENLVDNNDFKNLDDLGIKHFKPKMSYRLNRFLNYDLMYRFNVKKIDILWGLGLQFGSTIREDTYVGFTGKISSDVTGESDEFWVNFNIRAKYLYWGPISKLQIEYPLTTNFKIGLSSHVVFILGNKLAVDTGIVSAGLNFKVGINP